MSYQGGDFAICGPSNTMADPRQDKQRSLNYYPEQSPIGSSKVRIGLLSAPGLNETLDFSVMTDGTLVPDTGGVRGVWVLPGGANALWVVGRSLILTQVIVPATQTTIAQFSKTFIGNLLTNNGPVCIRDNGPGGYAAIVDGQYGYLYNISAQTVAQITDPAFLPADRVSFIDGWLIFNHVGTQTFFTTAPTPYTVTFSGSFYALKDSSSDNLVTIMENNRELWLIGERTSEVWYDAGGANFAFSRIPGVAPQIGCSAAQSVARNGPSLIWLGLSERGENIVIQTEQYGYKNIASPAVSYALGTYPLISDAIGFVYEEDAHVFYMLTFPTADKTWVYDFTTELWHERASYNPDTGSFHRFKGACYANYQNIRMVGGYQDQIGYQMSRQFYVDGDTPLVGLRRTPHIWSREDRKRLFHGSLQIEFTPGAGTPTGQGYDPQAMLRWSDDGGATFGNEHWTTIGKTGQYKNRAMWRRLGHARDRVYEVAITDPVKRDIVGATLFAQGEVGDG